MERIWLTVFCEICLAIGNRSVDNDMSGRMRVARRLDGGKAEAWISR